MNYDITIGKGYYGTNISVAVYPSINRSVFRGHNILQAIYKLAINSEFKIKPRISENNIVSIIHYFILQTLCLEFIVRIHC